MRGLFTQSDHLLRVPNRRGERAPFVAFTTRVAEGDRDPT